MNFLEEFFDLYAESKGLETGEATYLGGEAPDDGGGGYPASD